MLAQKRATTSRPWYSKGIGGIDMKTSSVSRVTSASKLGEVVNEVSKLKQELDGDIVVYASTQLVHTLMEHDLVDELRLTMYPVVLGAGERLFGETSDKKPMRLVDIRTVGDGLAFLTYQPVRDA
jgi:dihydrofolate reductase